MSTVPDSKARSLTSYLSSHSVVKFDWATRNCCHFCGEWVKQRTGKNPMVGVPNTPTLKSTRHVLHLMGGFVNAVTAKLGSPSIDPSFAQTGDIVLVRMSDAVELLGICCGTTIVCLDVTGHLINVRNYNAVAAWQVP